MTNSKIATRLYSETDLSAGVEVELERRHAHFLKTVLRLEQGRHLLVFNGRDGEWLAQIADLDRKGGRLALQRQTRPQEGQTDIWLAFAPVKAGRIDWLVEKATELGASRLLPVVTRRTVVERVKLDRLQANAREAAEQCERLDVPIIQEPQSLEQLIRHWPADRPLLIAAESGDAPPLPQVMEDLQGPAGLLTGPEGGFAPEERERLRALPFTTAVSLGPRILRADTAAIAAMTLWQATLGDWRA